MRGRRAGAGFGGAATGAGGVGGVCAKVGGKSSTSGGCGKWSSCAEKSANMGSGTCWMGRQWGVTAALMCSARSCSGVSEKVTRRRDDEGRVGGVRRLRREKSGVGVAKGVEKERRRGITSCAGWKVGAAYGSGRAAAYGPGRAAAGGEERASLRVFVAPRIHRKTRHVSVRSESR